MMDMDNTVARVLEKAKAFWQPDPSPKAWAPYLKTLHRALDALDLGQNEGSNLDQDQKEELIQLHTHMIFAYSQHNAAAAAAHYNTFVEKLLYTHWANVATDKSDFRNRACRATDENPGIGAITHEQPHRHGILTSALTVTSEFFGNSSAEYRKAQKKYEALQ